MTHFNCACTNLSDSEKVLQLHPTLLQLASLWGECAFRRISNIVFAGLGRASRNVCALGPALNLIPNQEAATLDAFDFEIVFKSAILRLCERFESQASSENKRRGT